MLLPVEQRKLSPQNERRYVIHSSSGAFKTLEVFQADTASSTKPKGKKSAKVVQTSGGGSKAAKSQAKPKAKAPPPKPLPRPLWTRVATDLTLSDAETRMHIREFVIRFASVLQVSHGHLEELDEISGDNLGEIASWNSDDVESMELISWVSDLCAKAIIQSLLDIVATAAEARGAHIESKALKEAAKGVKSGGANLSRLWTTLLSLRESLGLDSLLTFSDPLPPPASTIIRTTRQTRDSDAVHIANSAQLVPVIADLIDAAIPSPVIRDALEQGPIDEKEYGKLMREAIVTENNRWKDAKDEKDPKDSKQKGDSKALRDRHQHLIEDLDYAHRLATLRCVPRVSPLGRDSEGRIYYGMTPGAGESESAINLLKGKDGVVKVGRKRGGFTEEDRQEMERWSWFVAVWGRKPPGAEEVKREMSVDEDENPEGEEGEESWWGFWQPHEVLKMAEWLTRKNGLDGTPAEASAGTNLSGSGSSKANGARSRTSTNSSALSSLPASHATSVLSDMSDISDLSGDEDDEGQVNFQVPGPNERDLQDLVLGLKDFASLLTWRIKRASIESSARVAKESLKEKEKPVPASRFYA